MKLLKEQVFPIGITIITFFFISIALLLFVNALNILPFSEKIVVDLKLADVIFGMTIYLKVSVDFAIFMGNLIKSNPGSQKRIAIELGTSLGNAVGTFLILTIWVFFRNIEILLAIMILISSLVLLKMAEEGIKDFLEIEKNHVLSRPLSRINHILTTINRLTHPLLGRILPEGKILGKGGLSFMSLIAFSFTIPFILGLDDFAGYIPLFSIVNVISFSIGVFLAHTILTSCLFISPRRTIQIVEKPIIMIIGSLAFLIIAVYGFYEVFKMLIIR